MTDYSNYSFRFLDMGLHLLESPDKVKEGTWTRLHNVRAAREAQIQKRDAHLIDTITGSASSVHTIRRLDSATKLLGVGTELYRNGTLISGGWSGAPLQVVVYRPSIAANIWAYVTDGAKMRKVNAAGLDYKWGIEPPVGAATFVTSGAGLLDSSAPGASVYNWRYTYYSSATGAESNPSPEATGIAAVNQKVTVSYTASADPQVDQIRIYRYGGSLPDYHLVMTVVNATSSADDNNPDSLVAVNDVMKLTGQDVPFTSVDQNGNTLYGVALPYVWGPFLGKYVFASGDPNRTGYLYWCNGQDPDGADSTNNVEVTSPSEPLLGGFIFGSIPYVWSRDNLYRIDFGKASIVTFIGNLTPCGRGLSAPYAFCVSEGIYFLSKDGIYVTDGQSPAQPISEEIRPIFQGVAVSNFQPVDWTQTNSLRMEYTFRQVHFFYKDTDGGQNHLVYDTVYTRWRSMASAVTDEVICYGDENSVRNTVYFGGSNGNTYVEDSASDADQGPTSIAVNVRTGSLDMDLPGTYKEYGNLILDADPAGGTITVTPYVNAEATALAPFTVTGNGRQKFPLSLADTYAYSIAFDLAWSDGAVIYQMELLWRADEEVVTHWEFPDTAHGGSGWQHVRDAYIALRSTAEVTLTVDVDGTAHSYSVPSTGGARRKVWVPLDADKGKMFHYRLDATDGVTGFRVYGEDCEVRVKMWNTALGYQLLSPFIQGDGT